MHWHKLARLVAAMAILASVAAACGGGEGEGQPTPRPTQSASPQATAGPTGVPGSPSPTATVAPPGTIDLAATPPLLTVVAAPRREPDRGELDNDKPALAVGDFNGDGTDDLIIGAAFGDGPNDDRKDAGEAYIIFGSKGLGGTIDIAQNQQDVTIWGEKPGDGLGFFVASGDVNDDGIDDIIVSAPFSNGPPEERTDSGEVYVIFGSRDLGGGIDIAQNQQNVTLISAEGLGLMGDSLASGDVNGDGIDDIIAGAPFAGRVPGSPVGGPRTELGETYVVFGSRDLAGDVSVRENQQDFTMSGLEQYGEFGDYLASGDVNGDDIDDIIVVAEAAGEPDKSRNNAGDAYVFFGSTSLGGTAKVAEGAQSLAIFGAEGVAQQDQRDTMGFSAASGDVNGDGIDDIILPARLAGGPGNSRSTGGEAYVIFGSASLSGTIDIAANTQDVTIYGADANDMLGYSAAHDVNGDGIDDIILGTAYPDGPGNSKKGAGEAYVIFGSRTLPAVIDLALVQPDITVPGIEEGDGLGSTIIGGDLNDDGRSELIAVALGADGPDNSRKDAGEVYVISVPRSD